MPVNEKILFRSFQYLFFSKIYNLRYLSSAMLRENHAVFFGKKYRFPRGGGGGINIRFRPKYRPLLIRKNSNNQKLEIKSTVYSDPRYTHDKLFGISLKHLPLMFISI
jgi:hypothetical protein